MSESFYSILGVDETATTDEIKKAYRKLSIKYHPDKNIGNQDVVGKFQKINEAFQTLGDEQKRNEYDMMRKNPFMKMAGGGSGGFNVSMDDIFSSLFGGQQNMSNGFPTGFPPGAKIHIFHGGVPQNFMNGLQKPTPIIKTLNVTLEQVLEGCTLPLTIERWIVENNTKNCETETLYINVPKGADDGEIIILREKGNSMNDSIKGDVKIFIKVINETNFKRQGLDIIYDKNISLKDALCGFSFQLKHLNGKIYTLNNSTGSIVVPEYQKIMPGMGLTRETHTGNLIIHFHIDFPEKLSEEQIEKLKSIL